MASAKMNKNTNAKKTTTKKPEKSKFIAILIKIGKGIVSPFMKMVNSWKNTTTTKRLGVLSWSTAIILTAILVYGTFCTDIDMGTLTIIVGASWGEIAAYNAIYAWKSKCENKLKITYDCVERLADKYGIDAITPILQSIIND